MNGNIKSVESHLANFENKTQNEITESQAWVLTVEGKLRSVHKEPHDADVSVVVTGLRCCESEDISKKAESLVPNDLQEHLQVVRTMSTPHNDGELKIIENEC